MRIVSDLLRIPIHRWASIDASAFATMIDSRSGVVVDVNAPSATTSTRTTTTPSGAS